MKNIKSVPKFVKNLKTLDFMSENDVPIVNVNTTLGGINFFSFGKTSEFRIRTLLTKEPETINWINLFEPHSTFWDIGANIGIYSLYASLKVQKVLAFEPSAFNYFLLNKNIYLNKMDSILESYNIAFSDSNSLDFLYMSCTESSGSGNSFGVKKDDFGNDMNVTYRQSCIGHTIDKFIVQYDLDIPNYIKIDVDGIEPLIIKGGVNTFSSKKLESVLIEVSEDRQNETRFICDFMNKCGFKKLIKRHPPDFDDAYYKPFFNYIFYRK